MEFSKIYLCKADCSILGSISGLKPETCSLKKSAINQWEITFDVEKYTNNNSYELEQSDYYDSIDTMMRLYLDGKDQIFFVIDSEPIVKGEGTQEIKTVTAHSIECELSTLYLTNFRINCGTNDSQEYLATDSNGNFNNIDPYTNLPKEYISLVNYNNPQLSLLHLALQNTGWSVSDNIDKELCEIKRSFDISKADIYSFLVNTISSSASVICNFDRKHKKVGLVSVEDFGKDTGIFITERNLMNSFEINASSDNDIITKLVPTGNNISGVEQVVFGDDCIINLDYFMNTINEYGDYKYVSKELHDKYNLWKNYRETEKVTFDGKQYTRRELYIELSKLYNKTILDINELKNRVPNDGAVTDYKTFSLEELKLHLNAYNKALVSLVTLYKNEYGVTEIGNAPDYTPVPSSATNIKDTPYWYDYYAYKESIIPQIEEALKMYCQTDDSGHLIINDDGHFIELKFGNPVYYADPSIVKEVDAYKYEWSLYGLDELESKKKAWSEVSNLLFNECFIKSGTIVSPTAYLTPDETGWNSLSDTQKEAFTSKNAYINKLNQYLDYMSFDIRYNSLTKTNCKGIIRQCDDAIKERSDEISLLKQSQNLYNSQRQELANSVTLKNFSDVTGNLVFTEKDLNIINSMIKEQDYNNPNIITTNLDDIVTAVDAQEELYQAAFKELYKLSQPQYSFSTELDNLYSLEEFQSYHEPFEVGNFIRVGFEMHEELFDQEFIKLRLITVEYNPLEPSPDLTVEFSTMTKELDGISDLASLFAENALSSNSSSSSSSGGGGTYGNNDANVQISNNMLNALLSTELFGTTVTDVILDSIKSNKGNFNLLLSHSGIFDSLEAGQIKISGDCLFDTIKSLNWNGSNNDLLGNTVGTILKLDDGTFNFAGGKFKWDNKDLFIDGNGKFTGNIVAESLTLGKDSDVDGFNLEKLSNYETIILKDTAIGTQNEDHNSNYIKISKEGLLEADNAIIHGAVFANEGIFKGTVYASSGEFTGDVTANTLTANKSGTIAGWSFNENAFYKNDGNIGSKNGFYIGKDGISVGDYFIVDSNGFQCSTKDISNVKISTKYIYNDNYNYPYTDEGNGDYVASYVIEFNTDEPHNVYVKFKNPNTELLPKTHSASSGLEQNKQYNDSEIYLYENVGSRLILTVCNWFDNNFYQKYIVDYMGYSFSSTPSIRFGDVEKVWSDADIISIKIYSGGNATGTSEDYIKDFDNESLKIWDSNNTGISIDVANGIIRGSNYSINNDGYTIRLSQPNWDRNHLTYYCPGNLKINQKGLQLTALTMSNGCVNSWDYLWLETSLTNAGISAHNLSQDAYFGLDGIINTSAYMQRALSDRRALYVDSDGLISASSSSLRYKQDISSELDDYFNPHLIYDLPVCQFRYNSENGGGDNSRLYIGFIAEDVAKYYPAAARWNKDHTEVDTWEMSDMFPAVVKLLQEQHKEIEELKEQIYSLKNLK